MTGGRAELRGKTFGADRIILDGGRFIECEFNGTTLIYFGGSIPEMYRRAAVYVDRILKGARPGELRVEQPTKFDMVVNLRTARALGLTLPQSLLLRADEVLQ